MIRLAIIVGIIACCAASPWEEDDEGFLNISPFHEGLKKELMAAVATKPNVKVTLPVTIYKAEAKIVKKGLKYSVDFLSGSKDNCAATWTYRTRSKTPEHVKLYCYKIYDFADWAGYLDYHTGLKKDEDD